jgi:ATP-dependent RNA helicase RhlE
LSFAQLSLAEPILRALISEGHAKATPVQAEAIPHILSGRDVLGCAQAGAGKTAAYALAILHRLSTSAHSASATASSASSAAAARSATPAGPRCLVLCPTRELTGQIGQSFRAYGKYTRLTHAVIYGGVGFTPQIDALRRGVDILIATPGRLLDLIHQRCADLRAVEVLVLDEADRMLDMGFVYDIRKIITQLPAQRQALLFSATMPPDIRKLAGSILRNPLTVQVSEVSPASERIEQSVYHAPRGDKAAVLAALIEQLPMGRAMIFMRSQRDADRLVRHLHLAGISAEAIHGSNSSSVRQRAMDNFRAGKMPLLVATDAASRGIDLNGVTHIVNYDVTDDPEIHVQRIGRLARAGGSGAAVSLCDPQEVANLRAIEKVLGHPLPVKAAPALPARPAPAAAAPAVHPYRATRPPGRTWFNPPRPAHRSPPCRV